MLFTTAACTVRGYKSYPSDRRYLNSVAKHSRDVAAITFTDDRSRKSRFDLDGESRVKLSLNALRSTASSNHIKKRNYRQNGDQQLTVDRWERKHR